MTAKRCKDCVAEGITTKRPLADGAPGPRCTTHWRAEKRRRSLAASERRVEQGYAMTAQEYNALYEMQGGKCWICRVATGKAKRLAVDHDHKLGCGHDPERGCARCWRGLLCGRCNELVARFTPESLLRAVQYLANPPAQRMRASTYPYTDCTLGADDDGVEITEGYSTDPLAARRYRDYTPDEQSAMRPEALR